MAIVTTHELTQRFGATTALDRLSLEIPAGAVYGFIGPNGAGKTTTMRILTTLLRPTGGEAHVAGHEVTRDPAAVRAAVGFMPDSFGVYEGLRAWEYLDFFGRSFRVAAKRRVALIDELLELVGLAYKRDAPVMSLSRGMQQRLSLARAMIHDPQLLILDEPASGLDPRARIELRELLKELGAMGKTIMISSHILTELAEMCSHIAIIERGRLLAAGPVERIMRSVQAHRVLDIRIVGDVTAALGWLRAHPAVRAAEPAPGDVPDGGTLTADFDGDDQAQIALVRGMVAAGIGVLSISEARNNLEEIFMRITEAAP
jgi:ABC-2 type transport system ATP-binding protein